MAECCLDAMSESYAWQGLTDSNAAAGPSDGGILVEQA